ncbi:MAG TPA: hypothetical protein P5110_05430 [Candidatus Omnitrophota bacterium]|nr:hypothetical protein [Candidatus Omnitrophota bacterium]
MTKKEQTQLMIIGGGVLILALILPGSLKKSLRGGRPPAPAAVSEPLAVDTAPAAPFFTDAAPGSEQIIGEQLKRIEMPWSRDPFTVTYDARDGLREFQLKGISFGTDKSGFAYINEQIVKKGDLLGDYEVVEIEKNRVLLKRGQQSFYLTFPDDGINSASGNPAAKTR